jgi:hypothetical protein
MKLKFHDFEEHWRISTYKVVFKALILGRLFPFEKISTESQWLSNIIKSQKTWDIQYAQAYTGVTYIIEEYGLERFKAILEGIKEGLSFQEAMERGLGISLSQFEADLRRSILFNNIFQLYSSYTALLLITMTSVVIILLLYKYIRAWQGRGIRGVKNS